jgi:hypothetical protein
MSRQFTVLCLSSQGTAQYVSGSPTVGFFHHVGTVDEAVKKLQSHRFDVFVAALGTEPGSFLLRKGRSKLEALKASCSTLHARVFLG